MPYAVGLVVLFVIFMLPSMWVKFVLWRHSKPLESMPGTGGELALHLVERFDLNGVQVLQGGADDNYYNHENKEIVLSPKVFDGKSLTAVAIATHEVGHAIQFVRDEPVTRLRKKYLKKALYIKRIGAGILSLTPVVGALLKLPVAMLAVVFIGVITMLASVAMYAAILPEEYDASFNKAMPILKEGYIPKQHEAAVHSILRAAAFTYVAAALGDVLRLWRWFRFLR